MPVTYLILPGYCTDLSPSFYLISISRTTIYIVTQSPSLGSIFDFWSLQFYCHHYQSVQYIVKSYLFYLQNNIKSVYFRNTSTTILVQVNTISNFISLSLNICFHSYHLLIHFPQSSQKIICKSDHDQLLFLKSFNGFLSTFRIKFSLF